MAISSTKQTEILKIVAGLFNAAPGGSNLSELAKQVEGGMTTSQLADALASIPLFTNGILAGKVTVDDQVNVLMNNFGMTADSDATSAGSQAKAYFNQQITNGVGFGKIVFDAVTFLSATTDTKFAVAQTLLNNKAMVAATYSKTTSSSDLGVLQNVLSNVKGDKVYTDTDVANILAGSGSGGTSGKTFTLTASADLVTGTAADEVITAKVVTNAQGNLTDSLQNVDIVDGGAGNDTINIQTQGGGTLGMKLTGVETVNYTVFANQTYSMANTTGVNTLNNNNSIANLTVTNASKVMDLGVASTSGTTTSIGYTSAAVAGASDTQKISLNGAVENSVIDFDHTVGGIETIAITTTGAASKIKLDDVGAVGSVTIAGDQALTLAFNATNAGATALKTVDGSTATGKLTLDLATNVSASDITVKTNTGDDKVTVDNFTKDDDINLGAGTDTLIIKAADATTVAAVKMAGVEVLEFNPNSDNDDAAEAYTYNLANAAALTTINVGASSAATATNVQTLTLAGLAATATTLNLNGGGAAADEGLNSVVFGLASTTGAQTLNVNVTNKDANGNLINTTKGVQLTSALTANGIETINVTTDKLHADTNATTQDGGLKLTLTTDKATTLKVVSESLVDLSAGALDDSFATLDASAANGGVKIDMGAAADADNTVAANKAVVVTTGTGVDSVLNITGSVATTVKTGAGNDTITIKAATDITVKTVIDAGDGADSVDISGDTSSVAKEITLGAGSDTLKIATTVADLQTAITVTDFAAGAGGDIIDLTNAAADIVVGGTTGETKYVEAASFADKNAFGGMNVLTTAVATLDSAGVKAGIGAAITVTANDIFYVIASNGVNAGLFQVKDGAGGDTINDATITLVGTFNGISDASAFAVQNFADFLA